MLKTLKRKKKEKHAKRSVEKNITALCLFMSWYVWWTQMQDSQLSCSINYKFTKVEQNLSKITQTDIQNIQHGSAT